MAYQNRTYRIEGSWRHIFIRNCSQYFLTDLTVYADGMINCWGLMDFATFCQQVRSGWVATTYEEGSKASVDQLVDWQFAKPDPWLTADRLIAEVTDQIERLAGRPTAADRCLAALDRYLNDRTDQHLSTLREAYLAVPEHRRVFLLGDQDAKDGPLRILLTPVGHQVLGYPVQQSDHDAALRYFQERKDEEQREQHLPQPWKDDAATSNPSVVQFTEGGGRPCLANAYRAPIAIDGVTYPTVEHAYWALATSDPEQRELILRAPTAEAARARGQEAPLRADWDVIRLAVMTRLVREKFRQHPDLAAELLATGDARLANGAELSAYWGTGGAAGGRNWLGRILELVRAELRAGGIYPYPPQAGPEDGPKEPHMAEPAANDMMRAYALVAVDMARAEFGVALDFSERSVEALEGILGSLHQSIPTGLRRAFRRGPTQRQIAEQAKIWGGYLGEVMRRRWGGEWTTHATLYPGYIVTLKLRGSEVYPPAKVHERIVNGREANVWSYYRGIRYLVLREAMRRPELLAEAREHPGGWVYKIVGEFGPGDAVPPEAIRGAWAVDAHGELTGEFTPNPLFRSRHEGCAETNDDGTSTS